MSFFDGPAFQGLAFAQIGDYGALVRTETLVFTDAILHEAYKSGDQVLDPPEEPPYLAITVYLDRRDWITQRLDALSNQPHGAPKT